ncbi:MAG: DUF2283 domain-containing protein [Chloroflexi bacterium]|nr:DUF2283 domain-containing protein [Chloroflexota bacterium]
MEQVKVYYDPVGNSLTVWFGEPTREDVSTMVTDDLVVMKDKEGRVIGVEKLFFAAQPGTLRVQFETLTSALDALTK